MHRHRRLKKSSSPEMKVAMMPDLEEPQPTAGSNSVEIYGVARSALLLVESLIHGLIERAVISTEDAIAITTSAHEVLRAYNDDRPVGSAEPALPEQPLLDILASLAIDARV